MTSDRGRPTYMLEELWAALDAGEVRFHRPAEEGFLSLGWTGVDARDCLRGLSGRDFRKSMIGSDMQGWHDVYKTEWKGERIYIHFCRSAADGSFLIASFKRDMDWE